MLTYEQFMAKTAEYISKVQPANDRLTLQVKDLETKLASAADRDGKFIKRATQAAEELSKRGILAKTEVGPFVDKVAEDHANVWDLVEKLAGATAADSLGDKSSDKLESAKTGDPWYDVFFGQKSGQVY